MEGGRRKQLMGSPPLPQQVGVTERRWRRRRRLVGLFGQCLAASLAAHKQRASLLFPK